jgi:hypothetical protein
LDEATHPERRAEVAAVVIEGSGLARVCLITGAFTITKARIELNIPKRTGYTQHGKSTTRFYEAVYQAILRHTDYAKVKCALLGIFACAHSDLTVPRPWAAAKIRSKKVPVAARATVALSVADLPHSRRNCKGRPVTI